ncbi:hypothetical protein [Paenarthrobacter nicotinovorans]|jgi:hypothetical protein
MTIWFAVYDSNHGKTKIKAATTENELHAWLERHTRSFREVRQIGSMEV